MPIIYLRHPVHGAKVATLDMEADYDERNGWERYSPEVGCLTDDISTSAESTNALAPRRRKAHVQTLAAFSDATE